MANTRQEWCGAGFQSNVPVWDTSKHLSFIRSWATRHWPGLVLPCSGPGSTSQRQQPAAMAATNGRRFLVSAWAPQRSSTGLAHPHLSRPGLGAGDSLVSQAQPAPPNGLTSDLTTAGAEGGASSGGETLPRGEGVSGLEGSTSLPRANSSNSNSDGSSCTYDLAHALLFLHASHTQTHGTKGWELFLFPPHRRGNGDTEGLRNPLKVTGQVGRASGFTPRWASSRDGALKPCSQL